MIFNVEPLKNIPFHGQAITERYDASLHYVSWLTARWAILDRLQNIKEQSDGLWAETFELHCRANAAKMVRKLTTWASDHPGVPTVAQSFQASWDDRVGLVQTAKMETICQQAIALLKEKGYLKGS